MGNRPFSRKICNFFCKLTAFYPLRHGFAVPAPPRGRLCAMPESLPPPLKPSPWTDSPRSGRDVASATEWGTGGCDQREQTEGVPHSRAAGSPSPSLLTQCHLSQRERLWRNRTLCSSTGNYTAMPRALPLGELSPKVTERARMLPAERIPNRPLLPHCILPRRMIQ